MLGGKKVALESSIRVSSIDFITVLACDIKKKLNTHGSAKITGIIEESKKEQVRRMLELGKVEQIILTEDTNAQVVLFAGCIKSARVSVEGRLCTVSLELVGSTKRMDVVKRVRTFQQPSMTYQDVLGKINSLYDVRCGYEGIILDKLIGDIIVQYQETDWEFVQRLASHVHCAVVPLYQRKEGTYQIGIPNTGKKEEVNALEYSMENHTEEYQKKKENGLSELFEEDVWEYCFQSRNHYELGESITFEQKELCIVLVEAHLEHSELIFKYQLKRKAGCKVVKRDNYKIIGASLDGYVADVGGDKVRLHIACDASDNGTQSKWYPYSTVFSSPDGTGWYCMPEKKDRVRLYFPNEKEQDGYVISSVHESGGGSVSGSAIRTNPDNKCLSTKYGKMVELTPTSITMTNKKGMTVKLSDDQGIYILSDKDIKIESKGDLTVKSELESMSLEANEKIELIQGTTKMTMKDDVTIEGATFKMQ